ncbi:MAG: acetamidase/formamidase family protein [Caldilineaceae bacterium]
MKTLTRHHIVYSLDKSHPPALTIDPGETVLLETHDARTGTITSDEQLLDTPHPIGANPATGPIFVNGAEPGDTLAVEILDIQLADRCYVASKTGIGLLAHLSEQAATRVMPIREGLIHFNEQIRLPVRPMIGVIGVAPAGDSILTGDVGVHGGNMDNRYVTTGATVYLPVFVPGALLGIGDLHAAMGDSEITMVGAEVAAHVTVRINLLKNQACSRPWLENPHEWITTGDHLDPGQACRIAAEEMTTLLQRDLNVSFAEAYMLMSAWGDVQLCQMCEPNQGFTTARAVFPKVR